jgi:predicted PurR-regulated permease PerM
MMGSTWSPYTRNLVIILLIIAGIVLTIFLAPVIQALLGAALIAYLLDAVVIGLLRRTQLERKRAVQVVYFLFLVLLVTIPTLLGTFAVEQLTSFSTELSDALSALEERLTQPFTILGLRINPQSAIEQVEQLGGETISLLTGSSVTILANVTSSVYWGLMILISVYYFMADGQSIAPWILDRMPPAYREEMGLLFDKLNSVWRVSLRVQIVIFFILAVLMIAGTALILWLFQSGLIGFSPILLVVLLVLLYTGVQQLDNLWLRPRWMGRSLAIHPGIIFVGLMGALALGGLLGIILVVPIIGSVKVIGEYIAAKLLDRPLWPEPPALPEQISDPETADAATPQA